MPYLDLGTALLIWMLIGTIAHEYGHSFMAKMCGCKTIGFFAFPIPGVLIEAPFQKSHAILILIGGWIFGVVSILLFLPFVPPEYIVVFLITALVIETILSGMFDFVDIIRFSIQYKPEYWSEWIESVIKTHNKIAQYGLSKIVIVNKDIYDQVLKKLIQHEYSIAFFAKMGNNSWVILLSLLTLSSALMVSFINWPVFWILSQFGVKIEVEFLTLFLILVGTTFMLTITERFISRYHKK